MVSNARNISEERGRGVTELREVRLPAHLCEMAEKKFQQQFATLEELLNFVLRELTREEAIQADRAEQRLVEERLRELGYL